MPEITPVAGVIIRSRIRALAKNHDKIIGTDFLEYLDAMVRNAVEDACRFIGNKKIVRAAEYEKHRSLLESHGGVK